MGGGASILWKRWNLTGFATVLNIDDLDPDPGPGDLDQDQGPGQDQDQHPLLDQDLDLEVLTKGILDHEANPYPKPNLRGIGEPPAEVQQQEGPAHVVHHLLMGNSRGLLPEAAPL